MSESETKGRCRQQLEAWFANNISSVPRYSWMIADAIDRLAADVAAIKEAVCDGSVAEERDRFLAGMGSAIKERDAAIRERDEARKDVERMQEELDDREQTEQVKRLREANETLHRKSINYIHDRDQYIRERDEARAEVERLRAEVERLRMQLAVCGVLADCNTTYSLERNRRVHTDYDCASARSVIRAVEREIGLRTEVERLNAELAARQPAGNSPEIPDSSPAAPQPAAPAAVWLTDEERHTLIAHLQSLREQRRAMERGGQTLGYSADPCGLKREADAIDAILARAGSPPVVEVPELGFLGPMTWREHGIVQGYLDAMNAAGVAWKRKEVPRE